MRKTKNNNIKNIKLFLVTLFFTLVIIGLIKYINLNNNIKNDKETLIKEEEKDESEEINKEKESNEFYNISYYKEENLNRYKTFKENHNNYSNEEIVTYVNIGLDYDWYSNVKMADMSYDNLVLMNKYNKLSEEYIPNDLEEIDSKYFINGNTKVRKLRKEAKEAFENLARDSIKNGTPVYGQSAFRPYEMQNSLYNNAVNNYGQKQADIDTAKPGFSEHQTGLAIDVSSTSSGNMLYFDNTESFTWMNENAYKYGFILRYKEEKANITGFMYESWHYRYVGVLVATDMHDNYPDLSYDEYYVRFIEK